MIKNIIVVCIQLVSLFVFSQSNYNTIVKPRIQALSNNHTDIDENYHFYLEHDTLYANNIDNNKLQFLLEERYDYKRMVSHYRRIVFCYLTPNPPVVYQLKQWNAPIVIYIDKAFSKATRNAFTDFISNLEAANISNLNFSFTNKVEKANFYIKASRTPINGYGDDFKFKSETERKNNLLTGSTYNLITDNNNKFYGGILELYLEGFKSDAVINKRLKQLFFKSLGNFVADNYKDTNSLLHKNYVDTDVISDFDINILKIHYLIIYDQIITDSTFKKLIQIAKKTQ
ncbi:hypothetical protein ACW5R3_08505 [Bizionia sp. KMM 8389]